MLRRAGIAIALVVGASALGTAEAQMMYPGGYGGYGMSRWGEDPGAGYMAALGSYGRSQGVYAVEKAKADAINVETAQKWNAALRARKIQLAKDEAAARAEREANLEARAERIEARDGTTLNKLLLQILDSDPDVARASRVATPLSPDAIREIPFEWASEAITVCLDQMTAEGAVPPSLMGEEYEADRSAVRAAMSAAVAEDLKGAVSPETLAKARRAVSDFRANFAKRSAFFDPGQQDAKAYLTTLEGLIRTLDEPSMKAFLKLLEDGKERTVGDLIAFMHSFNLRFGPAQTDRQAEIYARLIPALTAVRDAAVAARVAEPAADPDGAALRAAATAAFKGLDWNDLDAHGRGR
ncbi:hypothetical protein [Paludisphaera sp.]|uniref:hypothetical protein n=1 Tax=Paludisphaera sp. TaxID=2017432 RepID=UPI00301D8586